MKISKFTKRAFAAVLAIAVFVVALPVAGLMASAATAPSVDSATDIGASVNFYWIGATNVALDKTIGDEYANNGTVTLTSGDAALQTDLFTVAENGTMYFKATLNYNGNVDFSSAGAANYGNTGLRLGSYNDGGTNKVLSIVNRRCQGYVYLMNSYGQAVKGIANSGSTATSNTIVYAYTPSTKALTVWVDGAEGVECDLSTLTDFVFEPGFRVSAAGSNADGVANSVTFSDVHVWGDITATDAGKHPVLGSNTNVISELTLNDSAVNDDWKADGTFSVAADQKVLFQGFETSHDFGTDVVVLSFDYSVSSAGNTYGVIFAKQGSTYAYAGNHPAWQQVGCEGLGLSGGVGGNASGFSDAKNGTLVVKYDSSTNEAAVWIYTRAYGKNYRTWRYMGKKALTGWDPAFGVAASSDTNGLTISNVKAFYLSKGGNYDYSYDHMNNVIVRKGTGQSWGVTASHSVYNNPVYTNDSTTCYYFDGMTTDFSDGKYIIMEGDVYFAKPTAQTESRVAFTTLAVDGKFLNAGFQANGDTHTGSWGPTENYNPWVAFGGDNSGLANNGAAVPNGTTYKLRVISDATTTKIYVNGTLKVTQTYDASKVTAVTPGIYFRRSAGCTVSNVHVYGTAVSKTYADINYSARLQADSNEITSSVTLSDETANATWKATGKFAARNSVFFNAPVYKGETLYATFNIPAVNAPLSGAGVYGVAFGKNGSNYAYAGPRAGWNQLIVSAASLTAVQAATAKCNCDASFGGHWNPTSYAVEYDATAEIAKVWVDCKTYGGAALEHMFMGAYSVPNDKFVLGFFTSAEANSDIEVSDIHIWKSGTPTVLDGEVILDTSIGGVHTETWNQTVTAKDTISADVVNVIFAPTYTAEATLSVHYQDGIFRRPMITLGTYNFEGEQKTLRYYILPQWWTMGLYSEIDVSDTYPLKADQSTWIGNGANDPRNMTGVVAGEIMQKDTWKFVVTSENGILSLSINGNTVISGLDTARFDNFVPAFGAELDLDEDVPGYNNVPAYKGVYDATIKGISISKGENIISRDHLHAFGDWIVVTPAGCMTDGEQKKVCATCGEEVHEVIPAIGEHVYGEWFTVNEASCFTPGTKCKVCPLCNDMVFEDIPAIGHHDFDEWHDGEHTCRVCGETEYGVEVPVGIDDEIILVQDQLLPVNERVGSKFILSWKDKSGNALTVFDQAVEMDVEFVETQMMTVLKQNKFADDGSATVRFLAAVDELDRYQTAGWIFSLTNAEPTIGGEGVSKAFETDTVYSGVVAGGTLVLPQEAYAGVIADKYIDYTNYLYNFDIMNIPTSVQGETLYVRPYVKTADGIVVYGDVDAAVIPSAN